MKTEGARFAFVEDTAPWSNQVHPVGPAGVGSLDAIVESVDECWEFDSKFAHASASHIETLALVFRAGKDNVIAHVGLHLPYIGRVRLKNIDRVEPNPILVLLGKLVQGGNLPPKWRSGIAPEDEHNRL
jgi:hypothetical protein